MIPYFRDHVLRTYLLSRFRRIIGTSIDDPELKRSQLKAFSSQLPLLYLILISSCVSLSVTHHNIAPVELSVYIPILLCSLCVLRLAYLWRARSRDIPTEKIAGMLRSTLVVSGSVGLSFTIWALSLHPYGNAFAQAHVVFTIAITSIGCVFCLMHVRGAAALASASVIVPFAVVFGFRGDPNLTAMTISLALVSIAMLVVLFSNYRSFAGLALAKRDVLARQAETQRLNDENFRLANLDVLTDLPNRRRFFAEFEVVLEQARSYNMPFTVGLIDLDGFKPVNDLYGHSAGDRILVEVGRRLKRLHGPAVFFARLGGDEFGLIMEGLHTDDDIRQFGKSVCAALSEPYTFADVALQLSGSIGFAICSEPALATDHLLECADYALYHAKQASRGSAVLFSAELETKIRRQGMIEQGLRHADLDAELSLVFQPIYDVKQARTIGLEALARWNSPTLGDVRPDAFIAVAERAGMICQLTDVLLRKALAEAVTWPGDVRVSFNLSMLDIASMEAVERLVSIVKDSGIDASRIDFEVTETAVMHDFEQACAALRTLKSLGSSIALDDFGSGYSSLSYVHKLPLDKIKIDRSFIAEIETDPACRDIVKSVVDLCRNLKLACIVEGTETAGQLWAMTEIGCWLMQGYLFSRPMPPSQISEHLAIERRGHEAHVVQLSKYSA